MIQKVPDRESLEPTIVAHRTQVNADPYHYERFWDGAVQIVEGLTGVDTGLEPRDSSASGGTCDPLTPGIPNAQGWALPSEGAVTSPYGMRIHPITGSGAYTQEPTSAPAARPPSGPRNPAPSPSADSTPAETA